MFEFFDFFSKMPIEFLNWSYSFLATIPWYLIIIFACFITFLENIFPPSPSDVLLLFMGSLVSSSTNLSYFNLAIASTIGSVGGFIVMYYLGFKFEDKILNSNKLKFLSKDSLEKPTQWFNKYGYALIVANRFLSGTRAVISFFAGVSKLDLKKTVVLSAISAFVWNSILIYLGIVFANNLDSVKKYIDLYGKIVFPILIVLIIILAFKLFYKRNKIS